MAQWDTELNIWRTRGVKDAQFDMGKHAKNFMAPD